MLPIIAAILSAFAVAPCLANTDSTVSDVDQQKILEVHNSYRALTGLSPLVWNVTLANFAESWVNQCNNSHSHSPDYGENMGFGYMTWEDMVNRWGDEHRYYNFTTEDLQEDSLHFTQMVWKETTSIGCAMRSCEFNPRFYSCNYYPHGNILGQFKANVASFQS
ncbi:CAP domain-containing protein [Umbelopsis sp. PMI_123]|nr:CAP domain-containing protein [Umbelopsis sp. PMI_123]